MKDPKDRRTEFVIMRVTKDEKEALQKAAKESDRKNLSDFLRRIIFHG